VWIRPRNRNTVRREKKATYSPAPDRPSRDVRKCLRSRIRDPTGTERTDVSCKVLPIGNRGDVGQDCCVENYERGVLWSLANKRYKIVSQVPTSYQGLDGRGDFNSCSQIGQPIGLLRPDQRFQPVGLCRIRDVDRIKVQPRSPHNIGHAARQLCRLALQEKWGLGNRYSLAREYSHDRSCRHKNLAADTVQPTLLTSRSASGCGKRARRKSNTAQRAGSFVWGVIGTSAASANPPPRFRRPLAHVLRCVRH